MNLFSRLFRRCPPRTFGVEEATAKMLAAIAPSDTFFIVDVTYRSSGGFNPTRTFEVWVYMPVFIYYKDASLEVAVNKVIAEYRRQQLR